MVSSAAGAVVLIRFPFSDLSNAKLRPAIALADAANGDWILCQVTSRAYADPTAIMLDTSDFQSGSLRQLSFARPAKLFTAFEALVSAEVGTLTAAAHQRIVLAIGAILAAGSV
jgi:mRNA interferase MazF